MNLTLWNLHTKVRSTHTDEERRFFLSHLCSFQDSTFFVELGRKESLKLSDELSHCTQRQISNYESRISISERTHMSIGLTVPNVTGTSGRRSSRSASNMYGNSRSAQHLCVPLCSLKSNRYSAGNISLPVPTGTPKISDDRDEQLLDPRLIPESVRRSLLALHRESHENMSMQKSREKTQSENDVNGAFYPWKTKMKSTMKRTPYRYRSTRPDTSVILVSTMRNQSSEQDSRSVQWPQSDVASRSFSETTSPNDRRSLKHYQAYSTQSTSESESTQTEHTQNTTNHFVSQNFSCDDDQTKYLGESNEKHVPKTS